MSIRQTSGISRRITATAVSPSADAFDARTLYEDEYCARGEMENRIKEQQLCLFADRTSAALWAREHLDPE